MQQFMPRIILPLSLALLVPAGLAQAQTQTARSQNTVEVVTVTARKQQENLQDVPIAITAFSETAIDRYDISNLRDVAKLTPSLDYSDGLVANDTRPTIRGLVLQSGRPSVAVLLDGVDLTTNPVFWNGGGNALASSLFELERVEVARGPQSVMFGRNAFGGAVHYITKKPTEEFEGQINVNLAEFGRRDAQVNLSGPITSGLSYRFGFVDRQFDGFYENYDGRKLGTEDSWGTGLSLQFAPTDSFTATLRMQYQEEEYGEPPNVFINNTEAPRGTTLDYKADDIALNTYRDEDGDVLNGYSSESRLINLNIDWKIGELTLNSITAYRNDDTNNDADVDYGLPEPTNFLPSFTHADLDIDIEQISQEFRLSSAQDQRIRWMAGALYWQEELDINRYDRVAFFDAANDTGRERSLNADGTPIKADQKTTTWAAFGSVAFDFTDALTLTVEARYSEDTIDVTSDDVDTFGRGAEYDGVLVFGFPLLEGTQFLIDEEETYDAFTPRVTLDYRINDEAMVYGTVSKGSKPGGVNIVGYGLTDPDNPDDPNRSKRFYDQETLWNYELGAKTEWLDRRLQVNVAVYYIDYEDQQNGAICDPSVCTNASPSAGGAPYIENAAESSSMGLELDFNAVISEYWSIYGSYAYTQAEFDDYVSDSGNVTAFVPDGDVSGNRFADVSPQILNLGTRLNGPITDAFGWFAQVDFIHQTPRYFDIVERIDSGYKTDMDLQFGLEGDQWTVTVYGENLRDEAMPSGRPYFGSNYGFPFPRGQVAILPAEKYYGIRGIFRF